MSEPTIKIQHNLERDTLDITKDGKTISIPRTMTSKEMFEQTMHESMLKVGCGENDINQMTRFAASNAYGVGFSDPRSYQNVAYQSDERYRYGAQNAYGFRRKPAVFPRTNTEMDEIMIRRVRAREQIFAERAARALQEKRAKRLVHWKHVGIGALVAVFGPLVIAAILRMWGFALAWIAS